ncbi:MAG: hypothetical protein IPG08_13465 [Sphingobacteriaceae bacterium]|nr:hypothetical protein [Sphingobacteriaceae bacterium]
MRKTLSFLAIFFCFASYAQNTVPPFINYQAVIRDAGGVPIAAGATFTLNFKIFTNGTTLTPVYEEQHAVTVPADHIINLRIGTGTGIPPLNNFSAIPWNQGQAHYLVSKDGNSIGPKIPFASVPYAFSAGGGSSTSYSPSANVSITGNVLDLTNKLSNTVSVGSNQLPNSKIPIFSADEKGRLTNAGEYPANVGGDIIGKLDSQFVAKLRGAPLSTIMPVSGQVLQFNGSAWTPAAGGGNGSVTINQSGIVNVSPSGIPASLFTISALAPIFGTSGIGTVVPGAYPNYNLNIPTPSLSFNAISGMLTFQQSPFSTNLNISPQLGLLSNILTVGTNTLAIPALNFWSKPTATAVALYNGTDYVGIGTTTPQQKLDVLGYLRVGAGSLPSDEGWLLYSPSPGLSILRAGGRATTEMRLDQNNNAPMTLWTASAERVRILANGNVGIGTAIPNEKLEVAGNIKVPAANEYLYASPKAKIISVPGASFLPENSAVYGRAMITGNVYVSNGTPGSVAYLDAGVNLPDGATVTGIDAYVVDNDAAYNVSLVQLWRNDGSTATSYGNVVNMAQTAGTTGLNANIQILSDNTINNPLIDNSLYTYYLRFGGMQANSDIRIVKVLISYTINKAD